MSKDSNNSIFQTIMVILFTMVLLMHMNLSGVKIVSLFLGIFQSFDGIFVFFKEILLWAVDFIFRVELIYMVGTVLILWFVGLPMLIRYRILQIKATLSLSILVMLFLFLSFRLFGILTF